MCNAAAAAGHHRRTMHTGASLRAPLYTSHLTPRGCACVFGLWALCVFGLWACGRCVCVACAWRLRRIRRSVCVVSMRPQVPPFGFLSGRAAEADGYTYDGNMAYVVCC